MLSNQNTKNKLRILKIKTPPVQALKAQEVEQALRRHTSHAVEILPGLYVGDQEAASDLSALRALRVREIINCSACTCANAFPEDFCYHALHLRDAAPE
jgi:hypothetical protein